MLAVGTFLTISSNSNIFCQVLDEQVEQDDAASSNTSPFICSKFQDNVGEFMYYSIPTPILPGPSADANLGISKKWRNYNGWPFGSQSHEGTPDLYMPYYTSIGSLMMGVPNNISGFENDHSTANNSTGYIGLYTYHNGTNPNISAPNEYREYARSRSSFYLTAGGTYSVTYWVSLAEVSLKATKMSALIYPSASLPIIPGPNFYTSIPGLAAYAISTPSPVLTYNGWQLVQFNFIPTVTGDHRIVFGNFENASNTTVSSSGIPANPSSVSSNQIDVAYYYIDDVSIDAVGCCNNHTASEFEIFDGDNTTQNNINWTSYISTPPPPGSTIYVDGLLHINSNVTLNGVTMNFSPNSSLIVDANKTLNISNSLLQGCPAMWQGIISENSPNNSNIILTNNTIKDAYTALKVKYLLIVSLINNSFVNNERGVTFDTYLGSITPIIQGNTFTTNGAGLKFPLNGTYGKVGITSINTAFMNITPYYGPPVTNKFSNLNIGIELINAGMQISNAEFNDINSYAVSAKNTSGIISRTLYINDYFGPLNVNRCKNGFWVEGNYDYIEIRKTRIIGNPFANVTEKAIWLNKITPHPSSSYQVKIENNTITNAKYGVGAYLFNHAQILIQKNSIRNIVKRTGSYGIYVADFALLSSVDCRYYGADIFDNTVRKFGTGVYSETCNCLQVDKNRVRMENTSDWSQQYHGIFTNNCPQSSITNNNILGGSTDWRTIGLRHASCPNSTVKCNIIKTTERALWLEGNSDYSIINYNYMDNYVSGIFFAGNAMIGNQNSTTNAHKNGWNKFTTNPFNDEFYTHSSADMNSTTFYFDAGDGDWRTNNTALYPIQNQGILPPILSVGIMPSIGIEPFCGVTLPASSSGIDLKFVKMIADPTIFNKSFPIYYSENKWLYQNYFLRLLKMNQDTLPFLTIPTTTQQVIDSLVGTTCHKVVKVDSFVSAKSFAAALSLNATINPTCIMGNFYKQLNAVLIPYHTQINNYDTIHVTSADSIFLTIVANSCPYQWGSGVWQARTFLKRHVDDNLTFTSDCELALQLMPRSMEADMNNETIPDEFMFTAYPNPAEKFVYLTVNKEGNNTYQLMDINGRVLLNGQFEFNTIINTNLIPNGIYVIVLDNPGLNETKTFKLVVNHE